MQKWKFLFTKLKQRNLPTVIPLGAFPWECVKRIKKFSGGSSSSPKPQKICADRFQKKKKVHSKSITKVINVLLFFLLFFSPRATLAAYGGSQARDWIRATAARLRHSRSNVGSASVTYTTAHSNAGCLTHLSRPGIEPVSSWIIVGFVTAEPQWELLTYFYFQSKNKIFESRHTIITYSGSNVDCPLPIFPIT